ncbi:MAG: hypothetical protein ACLSDT_04025 [Blautia sp.]
MATSFEPIMFSDLTEKTTAPSDADIIVIEDSTATKKAKWSSLISWIKSKLNIGSTNISGIGDGTITGAINTLNTNNVGNGQMLYVSFTLYGDNYWISSPIPCDQADKRTIALADNVKNPSADVNSAVSSGLFTVMKTKDAFYLITNDTAVAGYIFGTLHPNRMWLVTYNVG